MIGRDRRDVAARGSQSLDHDDKRLLCLQLHQRVVELLGARGGAAGRIDVHDNRRIARLAEPLQRLDALLVAADQPFDIDPRDRVRRRKRAAPTGSDHANADDRRDRDHRSGDTPECQLAPDTAAVDDHVRIQRHPISPGMVSAQPAFCSRSVTISLARYINCDAI